MSRPRFEVADIIRSAGADFIARNRSWLRWTHLKVLLAIARCRTAALGAHIDQCTSCGHRATISYNSCRNRHCPKRQTGASGRWIAARYRELLPTPYVHVVFTCGNNYNMRIALEAADDDYPSICNQPGPCEPQPASMARSLLPHKDRHVLSPRHARVCWPSAASRTSAP